jgi:uncharacterized protein YndB with AHSA1/START domain
MERITFSTLIHAPKEKVWDTLWNEDKYQTWTSIFAEGSHVKTDNWKEGSKVLFLDPEGNGMVSIVAANRPNEYMSFRHIGVMEKGAEDTTSDKVKAWAGAMENYILNESDGQTRLTVEMDISDAYKEYFLKTWPKALEKIKEIAESAAPKVITIETTIQAPVGTVWHCWTEPEHITQWCFATEEWHAPRAANDLRPGGKFTTRMEAKDGSMGFDFEGVYDEVVENRLLSYTMPDGRKVKIIFTEKNGATHVAERFETETLHTPEQQRAGWQAILDNFKKYTERLSH